MSSNRWFFCSHEEWSCQRGRVGTVQAKVAAELHPAALQGVSGGHEGVRQPSLATQWHQAENQLCASEGGRVESSGWLLEARTTEAESHLTQRRVRG